MGWFNVRKSTQPFDAIGVIMVPGVERSYSGSFRKWAAVLERNETSTAEYEASEPETMLLDVKEVRFSVLKDSRRPNWREVFVIADDYTLPEWKNMADFQEQTP